MELASQAFLILMGFAFALATLLGIMWSKVQVHSLIPAAVWAFIAGCIFGLISLGFWTHNWLNKTSETPITPPAPPIEAAADKADSTRTNDGAIAPGQLQEAQPADVPVAPAARPLHKHPTPEYIARILKENSGQAREAIIRQLSGMHVTWEGRFNSITTSGDNSSALVRSRLDDEVPYTPVFFSVRLKPRKHRDVFVLQKGNPLRVEGVIESIQIGIPLVKDATVTVLPFSRGIE